MTIPAGRAFTPDQKREIMERLLSVWERSSQQRLGQLLDNALRRANGAELFFVEDEELARVVEDFARSATQPDR